MKHAEEREEYELRVKASTNTGDIVKPTFRPSKSEPWGTDISFEKLEGYTYELKDDKGGAVSLDTSSDPARISATESVSAVVIEVRRSGYSGKVESDPIEFTKKAGNGLSFVSSSEEKRVSTASATFTQSATNDRAVTGDDRSVVYSISPTGQGATINPSSGEVTITPAAAINGFTVTATLPANAKYTASNTATYTLNVVAPPGTRKVRVLVSFNYLNLIKGNKGQILWIKTSIINAHAGYRVRVFKIIQ